MKQLKTLQEVAAAQAAGETIVYSYAKNSDLISWDNVLWSSGYFYYTKPKTKTITLKHALLYSGGEYLTRWCTEGYIKNYTDFVKWLEDEPRIVEIEE